MKTCTQCAKRIATAAKKCSYCQHVFTADEMTAGERDYYQQSNVVGIVGLTLLAIVAFWLISNDGFARLGAFMGNLAN